MTRKKVQEYLALSEKATPGPWIDDTYNTAFDGKRREMFSIPDHPGPDADHYLPNQIAERSAWYNESADNKSFLISSRNDGPDIARALEEAMLYLREGHERYHDHLGEHDNCQVRDLLRAYFQEDDKCRIAR